VVTNSPIMLGKPLELSLSITKHQPVTITTMPHTLEAVLQVSAQADETEVLGKPTPDPSQEGNDASQRPLSSPAPQILRFDIDQSQTVTSQQTDDYTVEQYRFNITTEPEHAGEYIIPEFTVTYRATSGEEVQVTPEPASVFVMNPNTRNLDVPTDWRFLILPAIVGAVVGLTGLAVFLLLKYRKSRKQQRLSFEPSVPPGELAHKELARIRAMKLPAKGEFKKYYTMVSESVRKFLGAEFGFYVLERTTQEVMQDIRNRQVPEHVKERTGQFLHKADMVKFAKYIPLPEEADAAMKEALDIVEGSVASHRTKTALEETVC